MKNGSHKKPRICDKGIERGVLKRQCRKLIRELRGNFQLVVKIQLK